MNETEVEAVARAICRAYFYCDLDKPDGQERWRDQREQRMAEARAAIQALDEARGDGLACSPAKIMNYADLLQRELHTVNVALKTVQADVSRMRAAAERVARPLPAAPGEEK